MDINKILKSDYLDILFEGRNKTYGGYELRKNYPKRLRNSLVALLVVIGVLIAWPLIAGFVNKKAAKPVVSIKEVTLAEPPPIDKTKPPPPPPPPAPPPPVKPTVKFTPPVIKKDEEVKEDEKPTPPPDDKVAVGLVTAKGDPNGIDPGLMDKPGNGQVEAPAAPAIFKFVEQMPKSPYDWPGYLSTHLRYPDDARESGSEGRSIIEFVVNEDGSISGARVVRSSGSSSLDAEAIRVVSSAPKWNAGKQQGKAVKVYFTVPITFKLE
ncbi:MAG: energy transducer TonB [Bacteroidetes bacterium]|nr:energy transducer TonB [Bacteroidota bacterium]